jgi:hypothetical protein
MEEHAEKFKPLVGKTISLEEYRDTVLDPDSDSN